MTITARKKPRHFGSKSHLPLTEREFDVLQFIAHDIDATGCQPSFREIMREFGWSSPNAVASLIENLENKGVAWSEGTARSVRFNWRKYL